MPNVTVNEGRCKGCALCASACPRGIVEFAGDRINEKGYHPAQVIDMERCTGCAMCATMCPDVAIVVER